MITAKKTENRMEATVIQVLRWFLQMFRQASFSSKAPVYLRLFICRVVKKLSSMGSLKVIDS